MKKISEFIYLVLFCSQEENCIELEGCPIAKSMHREREEFNKLLINSNLMKI